MSMRSDGGFLKAKWHWLVLCLGLAALGGAVFYADGARKVDAGDASADAIAKYRDPVRAKTGVKPADLADFQRAAREVKSPTQLVSVPKTEGSFLASEKRLRCKFCTGALALPKPGEKMICPFCGKEQPEDEKKMIADSDSDGLTDEWEKKHGLNPNDPADAAADKDGDLFTNAEEFAAKTDPSDPKDHPDYIASLKLQLPLVETVLPFYFRKAYKVPAGMKLEFFDPKKRNDYGKPGTVYAVLAGDKIGATGYVAKRYVAKQTKRKIAGSVNEKTVDVSVVTIERESDGKKLDLVIDVRKTAVDVQAKLVFTRGSVTKEFTVVPGDTIDLNGEKHKIKTLKSVGKGGEVVLENAFTGKINRVSALEP